MTDNQITEATDDLKSDLTEGAAPTAHPSDEGLILNQPLDNGESTTEDAPTEDADDKPGREAAKYRRQLRDTEAERDTLAASLDALQRRMVEQHAGKQISRPEALWAAGIELSDLLDKDGVPDPEKIRAACADASDKLGLTRPVGGNYVPGEGRVTRQPGYVNKGFAAAFAPGDDGYDAY